MKHLLIITADTGNEDATQVTTLSSEDLYLQLPLLQKVGKLLAERPGYTNWETGDMVTEGKHDRSPEKLYVKKGLLTQEEVDTFHNYVPWGEYGTTTITSVDLHAVTKSTNLLTP